ncbi:MAG: C4-dicarboxylate ABC transporter, partial [Methylosarcina sp.]
MRIVLAFLLLIILPRANALQGVTLDMASMKARGWTLEGIHIALSDIESGRLKLILTINKFTLPQPFDELNLARIRCDVFGWQNNELWCKQGRAKVGFGQGQTTSSNFSFHISEKESSFQVKELLLAGGSIAVEGVARGDEWQLHVHAAGLDSKLVQQMLNVGLFDIKAGNIDLDLQANGHKTRLSDFNLTAGLKELTLQAKEGQWASENLSLSARVSAQNQDGVWQWRNQSRFTGGGLFVDPIYLELDENAIQWEAEGTWNNARGQAEIRSFHFRHDHTGEGTGTATIRIKEGVSLENAELSVSSQDLQRLSSVYLKPFLEETPWAGISMGGSLNAHVDLSRNSLKGCSVSFHEFDIKDAKGRVGVSGGFGAINWSREETLRQTSRLAWRRLQLGALPIGAAKLSFLTHVNTIRLLEKARLPFLGGAIAINRFFLVADKPQEPEIYFEGNINNVSLEQLSHALNWTPLSGTISGKIPGVEYRDHMLKLGGELMVRVFDGVVKVAGLSLSGLFSDLPTLTAEITIDNLD